MRRDPFSEDLYVGSRHRPGGKWLRKAVAVVAIVGIVFSATMATGFNRIRGTFDDYLRGKVSEVTTISIASPTSCIGSSWPAPATILLSALQGGSVADSIMNGLMDYFMNQITGIIGGLIGGGVRNLAGLTDSLGRLISKGMEEQLKAILSVSLKPGGLKISYCYSDYDNIRSTFSDGFLNGAIGPTSGQLNYEYYKSMAQQGAIRYPDWLGDYYSGNSDPAVYIEQTGKTTVAMSGLGAGLHELIEQSKLPTETKTWIKGDMQRLNALSQVDTILAVDGAEAVVFSQDTWRRLSQFNPDSWDSGFSEQAMKDVPKLLYLQNQIAMKQLRLLGDMAIQLAALGQLHNDELANKALRKYMESGGANVEAK